MRGSVQFAVLGLLLATLLLAQACASSPPTPPETEGTAAAEQSSGAAPIATPSRTATAVPLSSDSSARDAGAAEVVATSAAARTPIPTPTPDRIESGVTELTDSLGLGESSFLGLSAGAWTDLLTSLLLVAFGYFVAAPIFERILRKITRRTSTKLDDQLMAQIGAVLKWLVVVIFARYAVARLSFLSDNLRTALNDFFFIALLLVLAYLAISLVKFFARRYEKSLTSEDDQKRLDPVITAVGRFSTFIILVIALSVGLSYFGVNANTLFIVLLVTGLIIAVGAKETIAEALAGFLILIDQPFRVGDSVLLKELDTWGDILSIGTRSTRILTTDNREVVIPNSKIVDSQILNYSYPDPRVRIQIDISVAYGDDIEQVQQTIAAAVRGVDGVLADKPVDVLFLDWGDSGRGLRVQWWIENFHQQYIMTDKVNVAIAGALAQAHIDVPFTIIDLNVKSTKASGLDMQPQPETTQNETEK